MFNSESKSISTRTMKGTQGIGTEQLCSLKKTTNQWGNPNRKKSLQFAREHEDWTLEHWKKVMWSDESRFILFQSDACIRVIREADEVMYPSCLVPTVQAFLSWWHEHIPRWQCQDSSGSNCERERVQGAWDIIFTWIGHHRVQTFTPLGIFGMCWRRLCTAVRLYHHQCKILVKN